jgi:K+-transporting ATPase c subunit
MVVARTEGPFLGLWGAPRVNVLCLNLDLVARGAAP